MNIIGIIVSKEELTGIPTNFIHMSMNDYLGLENKELPTIIIGWGLTKENFNKASILNKKISDNLYWTFSTEEKRGVFENDLKKFIKKSYDDFIKGLKYFNIDPIIYKINNTEELIEKIKSLSGGFAYLYLNKVVYIYHNFNLFSIDLNQLDFIKFDRNVVLNVVKEIMNFFNNEMEKEFKNELKYLDIKYLPYLIYRDATKNTITSVIP
jgi:hypothetical protein